MLPLAPAKTDFFLHRPDRMNLTVVMLEGLQRLELCPAANAIVQTLADNRIADFFERPVKHHHIANENFVSHLIAFRPRSTKNSVTSGIFFLSVSLAI